MNEINSDDLELLKAIANSSTYLYTEKTPQVSKLLTLGYLVRTVKTIVKDNYNEYWEYLAVTSSGFDAIKAANRLEEEKPIYTGDKVRKIGGSYQATGTIKAVFEADDGSKRYVFRFDNPPGLLHIFNEKQLELIKEGE